jgi:hypothetical protein
MYDGGSNPDKGIKGRYFREKASFGRNSGNFRRYFGKSLEISRFDEASGGIRP